MGKYVDLDGLKIFKEKLEAEIPFDSMQYKGTLGTDGTIQTLMTPSTDKETKNVGWTYQVISSASYVIGKDEETGENITQEAKKGDLFISDGKKWQHISSGSGSGGSASDINIAGYKIAETIADLDEETDSVSSALGKLEYKTNSKENKIKHYTQAQYEAEKENIEEGTIFIIDDDDIVSEDLQKEIIDARTNSSGDEEVSYSDLKTRLDSEYSFLEEAIGELNDYVGNLPNIMRYKGKLGEDGISQLPEASDKEEDSNVGWVYRVTTAGTYAEQEAKVGDLFISNGESWELIPSGDDAGGTATEVDMAGYQIAEEISSINSETDNVASAIGKLEFKADSKEDKIKHYTKSEYDREESNIKEGTLFFIDDEYVITNSEVSDARTSGTGEEAIEYGSLKERLDSEHSALVTAINGKANASDLAAKADSSTVSALQTTVNSKADSSTVSALSTRVGATETKATNLQSQIDSLVVSAGGDSSPEVTQARTDTNGVTHATLKTRIDSEVTDLKSDLNGLIYGSLAIHPTWLGKGNYNSAGAFVPGSPNFSCSDYIEIPLTAKSTILTMSQYHMLINFYDANKTDIGNNGKWDTTYTINNPDIKYIRLRLSNDGSGSGSIAFEEKLTIVSTLGQYNELIFNEVKEKAELIKSSPNLYNKADVEDGYYYAYNTGNKTKGSYSASGFIKVNPNTKYTAKYESHCCFYTENKTYISGDVWTDGVHTLTTPATCAYLRISPKTTRKEVYGLFEGETYLGDGIPSGVFLENDLNSTVHIKMSDNIYDASTAEDGYYYDYSNGGKHSGNYSASGFIKVNPNTNYTAKYESHCCFYNSAKAYIGGDVWTDGLHTFTTPENCAYIKVSPKTNIKNIYGLFKGTEYKGDGVPYGLIVEKDSESGYKEYQNGQIHFTVSVNQYIKDYTDTENALKDNEDNMATVQAVLMLPTSYKSTGVPTKLMMICHGSGYTVTNTTAWNDNEVTLNMIQKFLDAGYAVFDVNGYSSDTGGSEHWGCPRAVMAYRKAYEYVTNNYNVDKKMNVYAFSMGGLAALNYMNAFSADINAMALASPCCDLNYVWNSVAGKDAMKTAYGFPTMAVDNSLSYHSNPMNKIIEINDTEYYFGNVPPICIWHGDADASVSYTYSQKLINSMKNSGKLAYYRLVSGAGHELCWGYRTTMYYEVIDFLNRYN